MAGEALPEGVPAAVTPSQTPSEAETAAASEAAFTYAASVADILLQTLEAPLGRIGSGSLGATERRRLVDAGAVSTPADADLLVGLAADVGLWPLRHLPEAVKSEVRAPGQALGHLLARKAARDCDVVVATYDELVGFGLEDLAGKTLITSAVSRKLEQWPVFDFARKSSIRRTPML